MVCVFWGVRIGCQIHQGKKNCLAFFAYRTACRILDEGWLVKRDETLGKKPLDAVHDPQSRATVEKKKIITASRKPAGFPPLCPTECQSESTSPFQRDSGVSACLGMPQRAQGKGDEHYPPHGR